MRIGFGSAGHGAATGDNLVAANDLTLVAAALPPNTFGFFLCSETPGSTSPGTGSQGRLCLGGSIGRFVGPGQVQSSGAAGSFSLVLDLASLPSPTGPVAAQPGQS